MRDISSRLTIIASNGSDFQFLFKQSPFSQVVEFYVEALHIEDCLVHEIFNVDTYVHFAIVRDNKVVAAITGSPVDEAEVHIDHLAVKPEARGSGLGRSLVDHFIRFSRAHHFKSITLFSVETVIDF